MHTKIEILIKIFQLKYNPGGFTVQFYQTFKAELQLNLKLYKKKKKGETEESLLNSFNEARVILLFKSSKGTTGARMRNITEKYPSCT